MSRGVGPECASGEQRASLPTRSLKSAGASGAALGCAEAETPTLGSCAPTWPEPAPQGGQQSSVLLKLVITHDAVPERLSAVMRGTVAKVEEGLSVPTNSRKNGKGPPDTRDM